MKRLFILLLLFALSSVLLAQNENVPNVPLFTNDGDLLPPPAVFIPTEFASFNPQVPKVNVITGEYCEQECDLIVAGIEPLSYRRFYEHQGYKDPAYGHWRINPECLMVFNFELSRRNKKDYQKLVGNGRNDGSVILCEKNAGNSYSFDISKHSNLTHASISGQGHPFNTQVSYSRIKEREDRCHYEGVIQEGDGTLKYFATDSNIWPTNKNDCGPWFPAPPYQAKIVRTKQPNGNWIEYSYKGFKEDGQYVWYYLLDKITAFNSKRDIVLGTLSITYRKGGKEAGRPIQWIDIVGSDQRKTFLVHELRKVESKTPIYDVVLNHVISCWKPTQYYQYRWERSKTYFDAPFLYQAYQEGGRLLETHYDLTKKMTKAKNTAKSQIDEEAKSLFQEVRECFSFEPAKVSAQSAPVGANGQMEVIARYEYQNDHTVTYDGENNKTIYRYDSNKRITAVEKYQDAHLYCVEKNEWNPATGNLKKNVIEDGSGKVFSINEYRYDDKHNVKEQRSERGQDQDVITRAFSKNPFNLKTCESDRTGKKIAYTYIPETNLLTSELVYDHDHICKRTFHAYDDQIGSVRIKTIVDDGKNIDPSDLTGVSYRRIIEVSPKRSLPCIGLPEEIREKTIDDTGREILLKKVCYTYHPSGKILQEDHYDAHNNFCYSIRNAYDEKERLIAATDPLGNTTTFKYDDNFNLIETSGPRPGMRKEWVYDKANRPIEEKEWQSDGSILSTKKKYDKSSRVIATVDKCGFETGYEYDCLGRVTASHFPNGTVEKKTYDVLGNIVEEIDGNGYVTKREYNFRGQPTDIYHPDGSEEHFVYNNYGGTLAEHIDSQGTKTVYFYDIFDRPVRTEFYSGTGELLKVTTATFSPFNKLSETDGEGNTTIYRYDWAGRKIAEEKGGKETLYFYDSLGRLSKTLCGDAVEEEIFDHKGQKIEKRTLDLSGNLIQQEKYVYDPSGNCTSCVNSKGKTETIYSTCNHPLSETDACGNMTCFTYSYVNGFVKTEIDPLGIQTIHFHDSRGNEIETCKKNPVGDEIQKVSRIFDANNNMVQETQYVFEGTIPTKSIVHTWIYGPGNRLEKYVEAGKKETLYQYDPTGKLSCIVKPDKSELQSEYDAFSRLARFFASDIDYTYTYDWNDRVLSVWDASTNTETTRSYNALGNVTREVLSNGLALSNVYDQHGRRIQAIFPDSSYVDFVYRANRLHTVIRKGLTYTYAERDLEGHLTKVDLPANLGSISIERDALSRWKQFASPFYSSIFGKDAYDAVNNLCHYQYSDSLGKQKCSYTYDDLRQLTSENEHNYTHDSLYNRLAKDDLSYTVNDLCEVLHDGEADYIYDLNGNLISDGNSTFAYDSLDRLISVQKKDDNTTIYTYDPFNRRVIKTHLKNGVEQKKELYLYDGDNEIGSADECGNIQELRILGEGLGAETGAATFIELHGTTYIPIHDHRGCIVALVNPKTNTTETYRYTAFGEQLTPTSLSPWTFSSKRLDPETGFLYFGRRYYHPTLGRWLTQDPQGYADGPNLYAYLHNCPMSAFDPYGLFSYGPAISYLFHCFGMSGSLMNFFGIGKPTNYATYEHQFSNKSYNDHLGRPPLPVGGIGRTNGMSNATYSATSAAFDLSDFSGGYNVNFTYNATHGLYDMHEAAINIRGIRTEPVWQIQKRWDNYFDNDRSGAPYYEECHSQGAPQIKLALYDYPKDRRDRIIIGAFAPAAYIPSDLCMKVTHYTSEGDLVHLLDRKGRRECADTIVPLKRHPNAPRFFDHSINSPTFREARQKEIHSYLQLSNQYR